MYPKRKHTLLLLFFIVISFYQHSKFISLDIQGIQSWRQSATMWNIRNFARHDANILNPRLSSFNGGQDNIVRLEFPIMQWGIGMMQRVFGEKISIVRTCIFTIGSFAVLGMFFIIYFITKDWRTSLFTAVFFQYAPVFYYYTINPLPDVFALSTSVWYIFFIINYYQFKREKKYLIAASIFLCLSTLAKLPFLMLSVISITFFIGDIWKVSFNKKSLSPAIFQLIGIIPALLWYIWVIPKWGPSGVFTGIFKEGLFTERNGLILDYHINNMFPRLLLHPPVWLFVMLGFILFCVKSKKIKLEWLYAYIGITFLFLLFEFNIIADIHDYYMFPFLPWLYLLVGLGVNQIIKLQRHAPIIVLPFIIAGMIQTPKKMEHYWSINWHPRDKELFVYYEELKKAVPLEHQCIIISKKSPKNVFSYKIDKMGHLFNGDYLPAGWVEDIIKRYGIKYMYSDSNKINTDKEILKYVEATIFEVGDIKVFKLSLPKKGKKKE